MIFVMLSWILTTFFGRRDIYLWGSLANVVLLIALGISGSIGDPKAHSASLAQASLGLIISVFFTLGPAPASWVIIGETSSIRLRPLTTGIGRASYYIVEIPCIFLGSYMLNPTVQLPFPFARNDDMLTRGAGWKPRWQVRLRLGWHRPILSDRGILLLARDEGPVLSRDRHFVQAQGACSQVEEDGGRCGSRRVDRGISSEKPVKARKSKHIHKGLVRAHVRAVTESFDMRATVCMLLPLCV